MEFKRKAAQQNIDPEYVKMVGGVSEELMGKCDIEKKTVFLLKNFLDYLYECSPDERLWLIDQFNEYFCTRCGEENDTCLCSEN